MKYFSGSILEDNECCNYNNVNVICSQMDLGFYYFFPLFSALLFSVVVGFLGVFLFPFPLGPFEALLTYSYVSGFSLQALGVTSEIACWGYYPQLSTLLFYWRSVPLWQYQASVADHQPRLFRAQHINLNCHWFGFKLCWTCHQQYWLTSLALAVELLTSSFFVSGVCNLVKISQYEFLGWVSRLTDDRRAVSWLYNSKEL